MPQGARFDFLEPHATKTRFVKHYTLRNTPIFKGHRIVTLKGPFRAAFMMIGYFEILFDRDRHKLRHLIHYLDMAFEKLQKASNSF